MRNDEFDPDSPRPIPQGSCIHCGQNIWPTDLAGHYLSSHIDKDGVRINKIQSVYFCKHCKMMVDSEELLPF